MSRKNFLEYRVTEDERTQLDIICKKYNLTLSELTRKALIEGEHRYFEKDEIALLNFEIGKIITNVEQLYRYLNKHNYEKLSAELNKVIEYQIEINKKILSKNSRP